MSEYIKTNEHVFIAGMTGSGKSYFAETYLRGYDHVIKLDTKREFEERRRSDISPWRGLKEGRDFTVIEHLEDLPYIDTPKIIYAPVYEELNNEFYNEFFRFCFERQNTIVWIDELMGITSAQIIPDQLKRCITQGRSKNTSIWACTQRPAGIPQIIPANCTHVVGFTLRLEADRKRMVGLTGCPEFMEDLDDYQFWYYRVGMKHAQRSILVD